MARLVVDLPENSPGCILFSGPGGAAICVLRIHQAHANPNSNAEAPAKSLGAARLRERSVPFTSTRIWRGVRFAARLG
jgi:hypothetical protein